MRISVIRHATRLATRISLASLCCILLATSTAFADHLNEGDPFPPVSLSGTLTDAQRTELGLTGEGPWRLQDIASRFVIIEIFSMYCPHCQREAPSVNALYERLQKSGHGKDVKLIGIGAGNTEYEVGIFRSKYDIPFALFTDPDLTVHQDVGRPGTPHFFLVNLRADPPRTVYSRTGRMESPDDLLRTLLNSAGLE